MCSELESYLAKNCFTSFYESIRSNKSTPSMLKLKLKLKKKEGETGLVVGLYLHIYFNFFADNSMVQNNNGELLYLPAEVFCVNNRGPSGQ